MFKMFFNFALASNIVLLIMSSEKNREKRLQSRYVMTIKRRPSRSNSMVASAPE